MPSSVAQAINNAFSTVSFERKRTREAAADRAAPDAPAVRAREPERYGGEGGSIADRSRRGGGLGPGLGRAADQLGHRLGVSRHEHPQDRADRRRSSTWPTTPSCRRPRLIPVTRPASPQKLAESLRAPLRAGRRAIAAGTGAAHRGRPTRPTRSIVRAEDEDFLPDPGPGRGPPGRGLGAGAVGATC